MEAVEETVDLDPEVEHPEHDENELDTNNDRAPCWLEFTKFTDKFGDLRSKCKHCSRGQYKCEKKYGTTNLNLHLTKCKAYLAKITTKYGTTRKLNSGSRLKKRVFRYHRQVIGKGLEITKRVSGTLYVTSNSVVEDIFVIRTLLDEAISDANLVDIALAMKTKFDKYFGDVEKMNLLLYFSLILDPRNKVKYLGILLEDRNGPQGSQGGMVADMKKKLIMDSIYELYNDYTRIHSPSATSSTTSTTSSSILGKRQNPDALPSKPPMRNKLKEKMRTNIVESFGDLERIGTSEDGKMKRQEEKSLKNPKYPNRNTQNPKNLPDQHPYP
ncbi:hypothetical protein LXL04_011104 [Taraxacum kok-saghyz]